MFLLNAEPRVAVRNIARRAAVVLAQPDVNVVDLVVGVHELDRERQAVDARVGKRDPRAADDADPVVVGVIAVQRDCVRRVGRRCDLIGRVPE
jgi:hypothetical protein